MRGDPNRQRERRAGSRERGSRGFPPEPAAYGNLPRPLTSFVGREAELESVRGMARRGRLLTLTGVGGSGKTRLALEAARSFAGGAHEGLEDCAGEFPDGVWLVELDALRDPSLVALEAASALGVEERPGRELERELPAALRDERRLILLDNCEHLAQACAELVERLLSRCPGLGVLATSREPLGVAGEKVWPVPALSVPDSPSLEAALRCESAQLFAERAASASPGFELTRTNAPAIAEVCRRLEGAPLAIELAASRVRSITAAQISSRLDDALGVLAFGPRTAPERQRTLRATLDWSHDLLSRRERAFFRALSVFSGGFTLEAAEEVCQAEAGEDPDSALETLSRLVDKSLVRAQQTGEAARYRLPEVIRQYAARKLEEAGETEALRHRHAIFFRDFAEEAEPGLDGPDREFWLDLVNEDLDNVRAALQWAAENGEAELGLRLSSALAWFWLRRGRLAEGRAAIERTLQTGAGPALAAAKAIHVCGGLAWTQGDHEAAGSLLGEAVERFRELDGGDVSLYSSHIDAWLSSALSTYSLERLDSGETGEALAAAAESVAVGREIWDARGTGESPVVARALVTLGIARMAAADFEGAKSPLRESADLCRRLGDGWLLSVPLGSLAVIALGAGDHESAHSLVQESIRAMRELDDKWLLSNALAYLAVILTARGSARRAASLFGASEAMREDVGQQEVYAHYRPGYEWGVESARNILGEEELAAAWDEGRAMSVEEAISFALEEDESVEDTSTPTLRVLALGQTRVEIDGAPVEASGWRYAKVAELFFYLISHPPSTRERIGLDLWPDASPSSLRNALHSAMYRLRKALGLPDRITFSGGRYAFDHTLPYSFDAEDFEEKIHQARQRAEEAPRIAAALLEEAAELYHGDFMEGFAGGEWIFTRRQELRESYIDSQLLLGRLHSRQGEYPEAVSVYRRALTRDPYSAEAHAGFIMTFVAGCQILGSLDSEDSSGNSSGNSSAEQEQALKDAQGELTRARQEAEQAREASEEDSQGQYQPAGGSKEDSEEVSLDQAVGDYYRAAGLENWEFTYDHLDSRTQSMFTEEEWASKNQWFWDSTPTVYHILSTDLDESSEATLAEVELRITGEDGYSWVRTTYFVLENGQWKHRFSDEETDLFMPDATFEEFVEAQGGTLSGGGEAGVCAGVSGCEPVDSADVDGDGALDEVALVGEPEDYNFERTRISVRVLLADGTTLTREVEIEGWPHDTVWHGATDFGQVPGEELVIGATFGAHTKWYQVLTYRDGELVQLPYPESDPARSDTFYAAMWPIDVAMSAYIGVQCDTADSTVVLRSVTPKGDTLYDGVYEGETTSWILDGDQWLMIDSRKLEYPDGESAYEISGWQCGDLPQGYE